MAELLSTPTFSFNWQGDASELSFSLSQKLKIATFDRKHFGRVNWLEIVEP